MIDYAAQEAWAQVFVPAGDEEERRKLRDLIASGWQVVTMNTTTEGVLYSLERKEPEPYKPPMEYKGLHGPTVLGRAGC